jgi:TM2 domain-containing membrane protein YozV
MNDIGTSYLFWLGWFFGLGGLHRLYNKKIGTGLLWFCTWGLFGVGQFIDLVLVPNMVDEHNAQTRAKLGLSPTGVPLTGAAVAATVVHNPREQLMIKLVQAAAARGGKITLTQAVIDTGASFAELEATFTQMLQSGYIDISNDPITGVVIYDFIEL